LCRYTLRGGVTCLTLPGLRGKKKGEKKVSKFACRGGGEGGNQEETPLFRLNARNFHGRKEKKRANKIETEKKKKGGV